MYPIYEIIQRKPGAIEQTLFQLSTLIVPELRCEKGSVKPHAQKVLGFAKIHFDLRKIIRNGNRYENPYCSKLCVFPFVRAELFETGQQTFRGKEWCGSLQEALDLLPSSSQSLKNKLVPTIYVLFFILPFTLYF